MSTQVDLYMERLERLYDQVDEWATKLVLGARTRRESVEVDEGIHGKYPAPSLILGRKKGKPVTLVPQGANYIGGEGSIRMLSSYGDEELVFVPREPHDLSPSSWVWAEWTGKDVELRNLSENLFLSLWNSLSE